MLKLTCTEILKAVNGELLSGELKSKAYGVSTDSRNINPGSLFIPLIGENFDGHDYINEAFTKDASISLTHKDITKKNDKTIIRVEDTLKALGDLSAYWRLKFSIPLVAITGSVGKTSTKDMISSILSQKYNVLKNEGNFNNEIGLPLTLLKLDSFHEVIIVEMGMRGLGEIQRLSSISKPNVSVITNIGTSHIEKLGSKKNILKAKMEIIEGMNKDGCVVLNGDDKLLEGAKDYIKFRKVMFSINEKTDFQGYNLKSAGEEGSFFELLINNNEYKFHVPVPGVHNVYNALAAICVGIEMGITSEKIILGLSEYKSGKMRMNIVAHKDLKIINDSYNASPESVKAALNVLKESGKGKRTIAVLGDMLELGEFSEKLHFETGKFAASKNIDVIVTVGKEACYIAYGAEETGVDRKKIFSFKNTTDVNKFLDESINKDDVILIKGSRGMKMEKVVEHLLSK